MPRDGSGNYTLPANSLVSTGTASSAYFNNTLTDLQSALTQSLSKDGQTPLTGALKALSGTVTVPGYAFSGDSSTGWYQSATGYITSTIAGVKGIETSAKGFNDGAPATIASATTTDLSTIPSNNVTVTGTTTITGLGTTDAGITKKITFSGILTLTYNATSLILPSAASITTAAGDTAIMQSLGAGNWKCLSYTRASGLALVNPTVPVTGKVGQIVYAPTGTLASGTTTVPIGTTIPTSTQGDQYMTATITPQNAGSTLLIEVQAYLAPSANIAIIGSLFQDAGANAIVAGFTGGVGAVLTLRYQLTAGSTTATTFKFRAGLAAAGTLYFNSYNATANMGGVLNSYIRITEILP